MNVKKIQKELNDFAKKRDWKKFHNLKNLQFLSVLNPLNYWKFFSGIEMKILMRKLKKQDSKKNFRGG